MRSTEGGRFLLSWGARCFIRLSIPSFLIGHEMPPCLLGQPSVGLLPSVVVQLVSYSSRAFVWRPRPGGRIGGILSTVQSSHGLLCLLGGALFVVPLLANSAPLVYLSGGCNPPAGRIIKYSCPVCGPPNNEFNAPPRIRTLYYLSCWETHSLNTLLYV